MPSPNPPHNDGLASSPPQPQPLAATLSRGPSTQPSGQRERRNASVTPRKFRRFFTPRPQPNLPTSSARLALHEMSAPSLNSHSALSTMEDPFQSLGAQENSDFPRSLKRRKIGQSKLSPAHNIEKKERAFMPLEDKKREENTWEHAQSSPCERAFVMAEDSDDEEMIEAPSKPHGPVKHIVPLRNRGLGVQLLGRSVGGSYRSGIQHHVYPLNGNYSNILLLTMSNCIQITRMRQLLSLLGQPMSTSPTA